MITLSSVEPTNNRKCNSMLLIFHLSSVPHIPMNAINTFHPERLERAKYTEWILPKIPQHHNSSFAANGQREWKKKTEDEAVNGLTRKKALLVLNECKISSEFRLCEGKNLESNVKGLEFIEIAEWFLSAVAFMQIANATVQVENFAGEFKSRLIDLSLMRFS